MRTNPAPVTQVIILVDAALPRLAWQALLAEQPGLVVCSQITTLDKVQSLPSPGSPTAVLLDFPQLQLKQISRWSQLRSEYGLLYLVDEYNLSQVVSLLQAGAAGVLSRQATLPELVRGLVAAGRGEIVLPPTLAAKALAALARGGVAAPQNVETLTDRERDVLTRLAQGMTNKDIAQSLFLSVRTIEAHLRNIYGKLGVASRTEAVLWAVHHGFDPD